MQEVSPGRTGWTDQPDGVETGTAHCPLLHTPSPSKVKVQAQTGQKVVRGG